MTQMETAHSLEHSSDLITSYPPLDSRSQNKVSKMCGLLSVSLGPWLGLILFPHIHNNNSSILKIYFPGLFNGVFLQVYIAIICENEEFRRHGS
jgi:hypothetical protein